MTHLVGLFAREFHSIVGIAICREVSQLLRPGQLPPFSPARKLPPPLPAMLLRISCLLTVTCMAVAAGPPVSDIDELRATISGMVDARSLESEERLEWESRKAEMAALLDLHARELELLDAELEAAGHSAPSHAGSTEKLSEEIASLKAARRTATVAAGQAIPRTLALAGHFPRPLLEECESELATLKTWKTGGDPRIALEAQLSVLSKADTFNRRLTRVLETHQNRESEVLYLGLAAAFRAGKGGQGATGRPGTGGWVWTESPGITREIEGIFEMMDKKRPPSMVILPLKID